MPLLRAGNPVTQTHSGLHAGPQTLEDKDENLPAYISPDPHRAHTRLSMTVRDVLNHLRPQEVFNYYL